MADRFISSGPVSQALVATLDTYLLTTLGSLPVLYCRVAPRILMDALRTDNAPQMVQLGRDEVAKRRGYFAHSHPQPDKRW